MSKHHDHRPVYKIVWMALLFFTVITVWVASFDFGIFNIIVAMLVATIKVTLVALYFMHLKEDNRVNQVVFASGFVFLALFIGLTASDLLVRSAPAIPKVVAIQVPEGDDAAQNEKFRKPSPELIAHGKTIYAQQCQLCHGPEGKGDGPAAGSLNPPPRNFTSGEWKQGGAPSQVFTTVSEGIGGTGMASFRSLAAKDRWAAVHFIRSLSPTAPEETDETLAASGIMGKPGAAQKPSARIPVEFAIERLVEENR